MVKYQTYSLNNLMLTNQILEAYITNFWNDIFTSIKDNKHLMLLCKVEFNESEMGYRTLGDLRRVNYEDKEQFIEYLTQRLGILNDSYQTHPISNITFTYFIKDGLATDQDRRLLKDLSDKSTVTHRFNNMNLPITMKPEDYGVITVDNFVQSGGISIHRYIVKNGTRIYTIDVSADGLVNNVTIEGAVDLHWKDTKINDDLFTREIGKVKPLLHNGKLISIKLKLNIIGYKNKNIIFKDSYLLLPLSLRNLCSAFNINNGKGFFPFLFIDIFYKGMLPKFKYWTGVSKADYGLLVNENKGLIWNFKDEAIKYCKLDCKCLFEILIKFNELIFKQFNVNIDNSLTLPALAMRIYKSQFMPKNSIYQLLGPVERDIRESYTGGAVDVYIPHNRVNTDSLFSRLKAAFITLYYYDVNGLYPAIMAKTLMPVGKPIAFDGDISKIDPKAYGFFYCKITSPDYLEHPVLQRRIKTSEGVRTIAGLGTWEGWIFSGEMYNTMRMKLGYTFEIIKGYEFKTAYIFKDYVEAMYNLRLEYEKGTPMNLIAKLLMNSLYGKFGMKPENTIIEMFDTNNETEKELFIEMLDVYGPSLQDFIQIDNHFLTIRKSLVNFTYNEDLDLYHGLDINVAIASAISAGARVHMSFLKNNPLFKLDYSDTESAVIDAPLPDGIVGQMRSNEIGTYY
jgi:hypothetical protein